MVDPMRTFSSLETYTAHLRSAWLFHSAIEQELSAVDWDALGVDFVARRKIPLLEQDLCFLGVAPPPPEKAGRVRAAADLSFALGCLYVQEGATLGGQVISRYLATLGIRPSTGGLFFNGYGPRTGEMWKSFQAQAIAYCVSEDQIETAARGAVWSFELFRVSMAGRSVTSHAP